MGGLGVVFRKEFVDSLRERRSVVSALVFGPLLGPALFVLLASYAVNLQVDESEQPIEVPVLGGEQAANLMVHLFRRQIDVVHDRFESLESLRDAVRTGDVEVGLVVDPEFGDALRTGEPARLWIVADMANNTARRSISRLRSALGEYGKLIGIHRLALRGIAPDLATPVAVLTDDVSTPPPEPCCCSAWRRSSSIRCRPSRRRPSLRTARMAEIRITTDGDDEKATITVMDNGIGMPAEGAQTDVRALLQLQGEPRRPRIDYHKPAQVLGALRTSAARFCHQREAVRRRIDAWAAQGRGRLASDAYRVEALDETSRDLAASSVPTSLYVFSDMIRHAGWYSHVDMQWDEWDFGDVSAAREAEMLSVEPPASPGAELRVRIFYVARAGTTASEAPQLTHKHFWTSYFGDATLEFEDQPTIAGVPDSQHGRADRESVPRRPSRCLRRHRGRRPGRTVGCSRGRIVSWCRHLTQPLRPLEVPEHAGAACDQEMLSATKAAMIDA